MDEERRIGMDVLIERISHLSERIDSHSAKVDALDGRLANFCVTCASTKAIIDHDRRLREVERDTDRAKGLAVGASLVMSALSFLGSWFIRSSK